MSLPLRRTRRAPRSLGDELSRRLEDGLSWLLTLYGSRGPIGHMRRRCPLAGRGMVFATRAADVRAVLESPDTFHVPYLPKMKETIGPFLLGLDGTVEYVRARAALDDAHEQMKAGLRADSRRLAARRLEQAPSGASGRPRIDVIGELADPIIEATIRERLGLRGSAPLAQPGRDLFAGIFLNDFGDSNRHVAAQEAASVLAEEVRAAMDDPSGGVIGAWRDARAADRGPGAAGRDPRAAVRAAADPGPALSDDEIVVTLVGLISAWTTSVSRAVGLAVDVLLAQPPAVLSGLQAALDADGSEDAVWAHLLEAMRFHPPAPAVLRTSAAAQRLAVGSDHERVVRPGAVVWAMLGSAMMDETALDGGPPCAFRPGRPAGDYLVFGHGLHECFGRYIAQEQMSGIGEALLTRPGLTRVGRLKWSGPYPRRLLVEFD